MLVSFRAHLIAGVLNLISLIFTSIALFTCNWSNFKNYSISPTVGFGLYNPSSYSATCGHWPYKSSWLNATLAFMIIAFILQILMLIHVLATSVVRRFNDHILKVDSGLLTLSFCSLLIAIVVYGIDASAFFYNKTVVNSYWLGYSYVLACVATVLALLAGGPVGHALKRIRDCGDCECNGW